MAWTRQSHMALVNTPARLKHESEDRIQRGCVRARLALLADATGCFPRFATATATGSARRAVVPVDALPMCGVGWLWSELLRAPQYPLPRHSPP